ncbi:MAG TPA: YihY family inner membrane protein [Coxiellaceae bacterium]|nr:YihY family inner membrane protein [Coxiellaceae bacterium]
MNDYLKKISRGSWHVSKRFLAEGCADRAASLVYTTLLSLVPLSLVAFAILSYIPWFHGVGAHIQDFVFDNFVTSSAQSLVDTFKNFMQALPNLSKTNFIALIIFSLLTIYNISSAFNAIWHVRKHRNIVWSFFIYLLILILTPVLVGLGFVLSSLFISLPFISGGAHVPLVIQVLFWLTPYVLTFIAFTFLNWVLPTCKVSLYAAAIGGLVTSILFELAKMAFGYYLAYFSSYQILYGALAIFPIFLVWLYISWIVILIGAMISHVVMTGVPKDV